MSRSEAGTIVSATDNEVKSINKETNKSLSQNTILITLPNDSSTSSSPTNLELNEISNNYDSYQNLYRFQPNSESSTPTTFTTLTSRRPSSRNSQSVYSNSKRTNSASTYGMRRALLTGPILYENTAGESLHNDIDGLSGICYDCGSNSYLTKSGDTQLCENCIHKRWQTEISELIKVKTYLENSVDELKKYLAAKKSQCNENIRNSQQIKRFINMTMQQIKRKVELELENKRDELYHSIDNFVDSQKKISSSVNEDTFQTSDKICNQIENLILAHEDDMNLLKVKSVKTFAKSYIQRLNQQKSSRVPLYNIYFVPDSTVQVNNSFGKLVLKSYNPNDPNGSNNLGDDDEHMTINGDDPDPFNEFAYLNSNNTLLSNNHFDTLSHSSVKPSNYTSRWQSSDSILDKFGNQNNSEVSSVLNDAVGTANGGRSTWLNKNLNQYLQMNAGSNNQFKTVRSNTSDALFLKDDSYEEAFVRRTPLDKLKNNGFEANKENGKEVTYETDIGKDSSTSLNSKPFVPSKVLFQNDINQQKSNGLTLPSRITTSGPFMKLPKAIVSSSSASSDADGTNTSKSSESSSDSQSGDVIQIASFKQQILQATAPTPSSASTQISAQPITTTTSNTNATTSPAPTGKEKITNF